MYVSDKVYYLIACHCQEYQALVNNSAGIMSPLALGNHAREPVIAQDAKPTTA
jgi:hypothetical protein